MGVSRKQKASQMAVVTESLAFGAPSVEGGLSSVQASARRLEAAKATDGSYCARSEEAQKSEMEKEMKSMKEFDAEYADSWGPEFQL